MSTYAVDELRAAADAVDWLNDNITEGHTAWQWISAVTVTDPETDRVLGEAYWHGDGYWRFRTRLDLVPDQ